jgi:DNA-binding SARP family transcriptional activator/TolB-like protein
MSGASPPSKKQPPETGPAGSVAVRLRLIGQMEAMTPGGVSVLPPGRKTRALLAVVALSTPRPALRGRLAELLWSRRPEEQSRASLRQEIHRLLEALSPAGREILNVTRDNISLHPGAAWVDVEDVMRATAAFPDSLSLLDGDLLEDLSGIDATFDAWLTTERERLRDKARIVAEARLSEQEAPESAIAAAQQLLMIDRAHEGAWRALMRAYAAHGERGMAIQAYDRCRAVLVDLMDAEPSAETQALLVEIRGPAGKGGAARQPSSAPPSPAPPSPAPPSPRPAPSRPARLPVAAAPAGKSPPAADAAPRAEPRALAGGPQIGVLPLQLIGIASDEADLARGLVGEITSALARFHGLAVVSSGVLAHAVADVGDNTAIRRETGIDLLLDGTIQRAGERIRVILRLLDLRAGSQVVWTRRFDRPSDDILSLQDEIAAEAAAQIDAEIPSIEARRGFADIPAEDLPAYELVLRALPLLWRMERDPFLQAGTYLAQAIAREPDNATAHAWYAHWYVFLVGQAWAEDRATAIARAEQLAERAVMLDPRDALALAVVGHVRASLQRRPREALALYERALSFNPNLAIAWALSGIAHACIGELDEAARRVARYKQLSPLDPQAFVFDSGFTLVALLRRDHAAAVIVGRTVSELKPTFSAACKLYLSALGHLGHSREAAVVRQRLLSIEPGFTIETFLATSPLESETDREHVAEGLRRAGIAETDAAR